MLKDMSWAHVVRHVRKSVYHLIVVDCVQWTSVCPGGLRILSFTLRPDNMDGAESYESSTVFGPLAGIVAISL